MDTFCEHFFEIFFCPTPHKKKLSFLSISVVLVSVLLSALVERLSVSRMRDFFHHLRSVDQNLDFVVPVMTGDH